MNRTQRIFRILGGVMMILMGVLLILFPEQGYVIIALVLGITITAGGIHRLIYYWLLTRHMVGGRKALYRAVIQLDFGVFMLILVDKPRLILLIYLGLMLAISAVVDFLRFIELAKLKSRYWPWRLFRSLCCVTIIVLCIVFRENSYMIDYIYAGWWMLTGVERIIDYCRRRSLVYIQ